MAHSDFDALRGRGRLLFITLAFLVSTAGNLSLAEDPGTIAARGEIARMLAEMDRLSANSNLTDVQLASRFRTLANAYFDISTMARDALGQKSFSTLDRNARSEYAAAFRVHLAHAFVLGVRTSGPVKSAVAGARTAPNGTVIVISRSRVSNRDRDTSWFMCQNPPERVCDVEVEGVRASARQKAAFLRTLKIKGFGGLIADLRSGDMARRER